MSTKRPITRKGLIKIKKKLELLREQQKKNIEEIELARSYGDLRENAEYHHAKEKQGVISANIESLDEVLANTEVYDEQSNDKSTIHFGATVKYKTNNKDKEVTWQLVGPDEANSEEGSISITSPIGKELLGKSIDDIITVNTPGGELEIEIISIDYS